jgi:hypothetical protein
MSDEPKYRVFPRKVAAVPIPQMISMPLSDHEKKDIRGPNGCGLFFLGAFVFAGIAGFMGSANIDGVIATVVGMTIAAIAVAVIHFLVIGSKTSEREHAKAQQAKANAESANKSGIDKAECEAHNVTSSLMTIYESSAIAASELPKYLDSATNLLEEAADEFKANAFGPFWDAVENAAQQLALFSNKAGQVSNAAAAYYGGLSGRAHTFPAFHSNPINLPDPSPVINELRRVVRMGQTNFQFANIWEHRRTREVMIAGFRTLGEAVSNLGSTVESAFCGLQQSISNDVAQLVQEEISTRDSLTERLVEQNRMLDNIQHHRKPGITDGSSRY